MESNLLDEDEEDDVAKVEGGEDGHEDGDADAEHHLQDEIKLDSIDAKVWDVHLHFVGPCLLRGGDLLNWGVS